MCKVSEIASKTQGDWIGKGKKIASGIVGNDICGKGPNVAKGG